MDMFMDKLAQKLNAQEIIKANTAADTKEMNQLKSRIEEYNACLARLEKLLEEGEAAVKNAQVSRRDIERLTEESVLKIRKIQSETSVLQELETRLEHLEESLRELQQSGGEMSREVQTLEKNTRERLESIEAATCENVHKECVKVYRNVQAVITAAGDRTAEGTRDAVKKVSGKIKALIGISVAALVFSLAGFALQLLNLLNIKIF